MKQKREWFHLYQDNPVATNLSIASGGVKLLSVLLLIAAIPATLAVGAVGLRIMTVSSWSTSLIFLMDELSEELFLVFFLWSAVIICRYVSSVLQGKAALLNAAAHMPVVVEEPERTTE